VPGANGNQRTGGKAARIGAAVAAVLVAVGITLAVTLSGGSTATTAGGSPKLKLASLSTLGTLRAAPAAGPAGPEGVPIPAVPPLTGTATKATGQQVDGIGCDTSRSPSTPRSSSRSARRWSRRRRSPSRMGCDRPGQARRRSASQACTVVPSKPRVTSNVAAAMVSTTQPSANAARNSSWRTRRGPNVPGCRSLKHIR